MYEITSYTKEKAKGLGVVVKPSTVKGKKIDVFKNEKKIASIGDIKYSDYPTYLKEDGKAVADERKRLYHLRHQKESNKIGTPSFFAKKLLW